MYFLLSEKHNIYTIIDVKYILTYIDKKILQRLELELKEVELSNDPDVVMIEKTEGIYITNYMPTILRTHFIYDLSTIEMLVNHNPDNKHILYRIGFHYNNVDIIEHLIKENIKPSDNCIPLCLNFTPEMIDCILENNDYLGLNLLKIIEKYSYIFDAKNHNLIMHIIKFLLLHNIDINYTMVTTYVSCLNNLNIIKLLVEYNKIENDNIVLASQYGFIDIVKYLYESGIYTPHHIKKAIIETRSLDVRCFLINHCAEYDRETMIQSFKYSIIFSKIDIVVYITQNELNIEDIENIFMEIDVIRYDFISIHILKYIINLSPIITNHIYQNYPAILARTILEKDIEFIHKLIDYNIFIDPDMSNQYDCPMYNAIQMNSIDIIKILMDTGIQFKNYNKYIEDAYIMINVDTLKYLIENNVHIDLKNIFKLAYKFYDNKTIEYLVFIMDNLNLVDTYIASYKQSFSDIKSDCFTKYILNSSRQFECSILQKIQIEIINDIDCRDSILQNELCDNLEIAYIALRKKNTQIINFLIDINSHNNEYLEWLYVLSAYDINLMISILDKINIDIKPRSLETMIYASINNEDIDYFLIHGCSPLPELNINHMDLPAIKFLNEIDPDVMNYYFK
ncbi:ankyrin repeat protein [Megavirus chiliensis]|uniref:Ankyrin repeat protein n=2 Tax=Megamimivirinae TaxID=3044648 RepID=A0A2L2DLM8_MIMIV|nr:putative ankyrin repeat protein [Megavirus chiliensis]AEQ32465.1 ankyrin repeat protein [Megavirus chiliensis]AVG47037.1 ankyrin repeat protein [Acanthamoeba polyphaga mimivirus]